MAETPAPARRAGSSPEIRVVQAQPAAPDARLAMVAAPDSPQAAAYRVLRHRIEADTQAHTIAVLSAAPREGKTTVALNLALALAVCGRARVLVIEGNFRAPGLARLAGVAPTECLSVQLQAHQDRPSSPWTVVEAFGPHLHLLPLSPEVAPRPLIDAPTFGRALEILHDAGYDYVIVDGPHVLGIADANLVEECTDGVLMVATAGSTSGRDLVRAVEQLSPRRLLGACLLDTDGHAR